MRKYYLIILLLFTCMLNAKSQQVNVDSIRIVSLLMQLPDLKDKARVDCLNDIAREYAYLGPEKKD